MIINVWFYIIPTMFHGWYIFGSFCLNIIVCSICFLGCNKAIFICMYRTVCIVSHFPFVHLCKQKNWGLGPIQLSLLYIYIHIYIHTYIHIYACILRYTSIIPMQMKMSRTLHIPYSAKFSRVFNFANFNHM